MHRSILATHKFSFLFQTSLFFFFGRISNLKFKTLALSMHHLNYIWFFLLRKILFLGSQIFMIKFLGSIVALTSISPSNILDFTAISELVEKNFDHLPYLSWEQYVKNKYLMLMDVHKHLYSYRFVIQMNVTGSASVCCPHHL